MQELIQPQKMIIHCRCVARFSDAQLKRRLPTTSQESAVRPQPRRASLSNLIVSWCSCKEDTEAF